MKSGESRTLRAEGQSLSGLWEGPVSVWIAWHVNLLPQWLNFKLFLVGFPTKNDQNQKVVAFFTRETD